MASTETPTMDALTERTRSIWSAGDYDRISAGFRHEAEAFVERRQLKKGMRVLDAACGSGNLTIPAARAGAEVTGFDLVSSLLAATAAWAARERLAIQLDEGTVEEMPYEDASFDVVLSMFGLMFAARPERVTEELKRVTRPGGRIALAHWVRSGFIGQMLAKHVAFVPPPAGLASPLLWADEAIVRERLPEQDWLVSLTPRTLTFKYPHSPIKTAELFRTAYGPTVRTFQALEEDRHEAFAAELENHWVQHHRGTEDSTEVRADYLEIVAIRK